MKILVVLAVGFLMLSANAQATESPGQEQQQLRHCTIGDVSSTLQAFYVGLWGVSDFLTNIKIAGVGGGVNCQYRLFLPQKPSNGERFAFCEDEVFLGAVVFFVPYQQIGISRKLATEDLDSISSTVSFGPITGTQSERSLIRIANKNFVIDGTGNVVYTQEGFITQEQPGTYLSKWTAFFLGAPFAYVEVEVDVVTHEEHVHRVENGTWRTW